MARRWLILSLLSVNLCFGQTFTPSLNLQQPAPENTAAGSPPTPLKLGPLTITGTWRVRLEAWNWFAGDAESTYAYPHSILRVGLSQQFRRFGWHLELAQPSVFATPDDAVAPGVQGQMGLGATYYVANNRQRNAAGIYPSRAYVELKGFAGHDSNRLVVGRFVFIDGTEVVPKDKTLAALKQSRIAHRLLGDFGWSVAGRAEDGLQFQMNTNRVNLTVAAARPTRGVYQMDGWGSLDIGWTYGAATVPISAKMSAGELRVFALGYEDVRAVAKTDNRPAAVRNGADRFANLRIATFGAHYLHVFDTTAGQLDLLFWGAGQTGDWGVQRHRANAVAAEAGWQPELPRLKPWVRIGYFRGSGDGNPNDNTHNTFFAVLPTPRWYARYPFYNEQNNEDFSAALILRPTAKLNIRTEAHALRLTDKNDLWYQGGGAFQPRTFGYTGRPSGGSRGLANLWDISADYQLSPKIGVGFYFANVWGKAVIKTVYPSGPNSQFGYTELTYRF